MCQRRRYQKSLVDSSAIHDSSAIPTITKQIYQRISETMNVKGWHEKAGICRFRLLPFGVKRGRSGQRNTSLVKYVRGYERSSICPLSTVLPSSLLQHALRPSPSSRAAGRSPFLSSVQFKENACRGHAPIHSYGFASLVDTRYSCVWPVREPFYAPVSFKCAVLSHDTDWFMFPSRSPSLRRCYFTIWWIWMFNFKVLRTY